MLDEFVATIGYHRKYVITLLRGKVERREPGSRQARQPYYTPMDRRALLRLAALFDQIGSNSTLRRMSGIVSVKSRHGRLRRAGVCGSTAPLRMRCTTSGASARRSPRYTPGMRALMAG